MKFINYLENISGVSVFGLTSFLLFGLFFIGVLLWAVKADKTLIDETKNLPLQ